jgi:hypothetical protein
MPIIKRASKADQGQRRAVGGRMKSESKRKQGEKEGVEEEVTLRERRG